MNQVEVGLKPWTKDSPGAAKVGRLAELNLGCGPILLVIGLVGLGAAIWDHQYSLYFGGPFLVLVGAVMLWLGLRVRRITRSPAPEHPNALVAFLIEDGTVIFPAGPNRAEERWPLAETAFSVGSVLGQPALIVSSTGHRARRFPAAALTVPPGEAVAVAERARRSG